MFRSNTALDSDSELAAIIEAIGNQTKNSSHEDLTELLSRLQKIQTTSISKKIKLNYYNGVIYGLLKNHDMQMQKYYDVLIKVQTVDFSNKFSKLPISHQQVSKDIAATIAYELHLIYQRKGDELQANAKFKAAEYQYHQASFLLKLHSKYNPKVEFNDAIIQTRLSDNETQKKNGGKNKSILPDFFKTKESDTKKTSLFDGFFKTSNKKINTKDKSLFFALLKQIKAEEVDNHGKTWLEIAAERGPR